jgi:hypothetical protein
MAQYWRVSPRIWLHHDWDEDTKLLALYILTCDHRTTEGLFRLPKPYICADLQWLPERLGKPFSKLLANGFIEYDETAQVVLIVKALKWQRPDNPNQQTAAIKALEELPETRLWERFLTVAEEYAKGFAQALRQAFPQGYGNSPAPSPPPSPTLNTSDGDPPQSDGQANQFNPYACWEQTIGQTIGPKHMEMFENAAKQGMDDQVLVWCINQTVGAEKPISYFESTIDALLHAEPPVLNMWALRQRERQRKQRTGGKAQSLDDILAGITGVAT